VEDDDDDDDDVTAKRGDSISMTSPATYEDVANSPY
jgi:hypothetical protein